MIINFLFFLESRFVPFKSLRHDTLSEEGKSNIQKSLTRTNFKNEKKQVELMPVPSNKYSSLKAKTVSMKESIILQKDQAEKLKDIQNKQAAERLAACNSTSSIEVVTSLSASQKMAYRDPKQNGANFVEETYSINKDTHEEYESNEDSEGGSENEDGIRVNFTVEEN